MSIPDWDTVDGRTVEVFGQRVPVHTIDGDPLGIVRTTPSGVPVEIVGEGYSLGYFDATVGQLRRMTKTEWSAIAVHGNAPSVDGTLLAPLDE